jgi:hypothetical protein
LPFTDEIPAFASGWLSETPVELLEVEVLFFVQCVGVRSIRYFWAVFVLLRSTSVLL